MSSTRLPGKVLEPILGRPMVLRLVDRIRLARSIDEVVVATSTDPSDDRLVSVLEEDGVAVRRGNLHDVLSRFLGVIDEFDPDLVVRLTGDNPLVDGRIIDQVVGQHSASGADYSSTGLSGTYPYGFQVEVVSPTALRSIAVRGASDEEREHVTLGIYSRPSEFEVRGVAQDRDDSSLRWTVDYPDDLAWVREVYAALHPANPSFGYSDVIALIEQEPGFRRSVDQVLR